jgi:hypothetical protein
MNKEKPIIEFAESEKENARPDIIKECRNCGEILANDLIKCNSCGSKNLKNRQITSHADSGEKQYPVLVITKEILKENLVPSEIVDKMNDNDLLELALYMEKIILTNFKNFIPLAVKGFINKK